MSEGPYKVQELTDAERQAFLRGGFQALGRPLKPDHRKMLVDGFELKGWFEMTCRDARSGEVEWEHKQDNIITDYGRSEFWGFGWAPMQLGFAPSTETPNLLRTSILTDGNQAFAYGTSITAVVTPSTYTRTYGPVTFGQPGSNRTLGTLFTAYYTGTVVSANLGVYYCWSYALLTPPKTQTTTQTIELIYKMSINPIY
jgi:hypothetical protein